MAMSKIIDLEATVTGIVREILAPAGTKVAEGDPVVSMESMKMEIPVVATSNGTVVEVLVKKDDLVEEGQVIARLET